MEDDYPSTPPSSRYSHSEPLLSPHPTIKSQTTASIDALKHRIAHIFHKKTSSIPNRPRRFHKFRKTRPHNVSRANFFRRIIPTASTTRRRGVQLNLLRVRRKPSALEFSCVGAREGGECASIMLLTSQRLSTVWMYRAPEVLNIDDGMFTACSLCLM